ncbi:zinc finger protein 253-like [Octopus bimaculoides]|uniref:zinc finger protein 253-like n=1 Tax=Octopus bimaculoides TaxID=37653 RepID=UPI0022DFFC2F|nr:zinc finger protein 253-like [Octopus bimaculoides]
MEEDPNDCNTCSKSSVNSLYSHKCTHTGEKLYHCDICGKAFSMKCSLSKHNRTHTGEKPYGCGICNKRFSRSSSLSTHKRFHTGEKPHRCSICVTKTLKLDKMALYEKN